MGSLLTAALPLSNCSSEALTNILSVPQGLCRSTMVKLSGSTYTG